MQRWKRLLLVAVVLLAALVYNVWVNQAQPDFAPSQSAIMSSAPSSAAPSVALSGADSTTQTAPLPEDGAYTSKDEVALYLLQYGRLPDNFITKKQAEALGWEGGSLEPFAPGKSIGGSHFGNYEGALPERDGRTYKECDIDTQGAKSRGAKRLVFSNDGLIYYTGDHYKSFTLLYGEDYDAGNH